MDFEFDIKGNFIAAIFWFFIGLVLQFLVDLVRPAFLQVLPSILQSAFGFILAFFIVFAAFGLLTMKRVPTDVQAFLFFPKGTDEQDMTLTFSETHHYPRTIVNFKITPPVAYYLPVGSYGWDFIRKHRESWVSESARTIKNPRFLETWCKQRGYQLMTKTAGRTELFYRGYYNVHAELDKRLEHVEYRYFYPFWHRFLPPSAYPSRRCILNWSTHEAWVLDQWAIEYATTGKIRGTTLFWWPSRHYVQKWARRNGFAWSEELPTMQDLLAKGKKTKCKTTLESS